MLCKRFLVSLFIPLGSFISPLIHCVWIEYGESVLSYGSFLNNENDEKLNNRNRKNGLHLLLEELADQNAKAPDICLERIATRYSKKYFWSSVADSSTVCRRSEVVWRIELFCKPEVDQLGISSLIKHDIFRFEVSVDDVEGSEWFKSAEDLARVEGDPPQVLLKAEFPKVHLILDEPIQILTREIFKDQVDVVLVNEGVFQIDNVIER